MKISLSKQLYQKAQQYIPGGVNSPARAFKSVQMNPLFIQKAKGSKIFDVDGNEFIDYVGSWGPMILGHAYEEVLEALKEAIHDGVSYGAPIEKEILLAELVQSFFPSMEMMRMVNSGTEATMSALRVARAYTKRDKIIKFVGCYHGHADFLLVKAGSGATTLGSPDSPGVPEDFSKHTLLAQYNSTEDIQNIFESYPDEIAACIIEPIVGNMGFILPQNNFLQQLRSLCDQYGSLLIFDEVMTGFRVSKGGAQELFHIVPDLTCLGKVIGGGLPVGCYGGRRDVMEHVSPSGKVYQAGTLSGNPLAMTAGIATLQALQKEGVYPELSSKTSWLMNEMKTIAEKVGIPMQIEFACSMFGFFFSSNPVTNFEEASQSDISFFIRFFKQMLLSGVYIAPSAFEAGFMSLAHSQEDLEKTAQVFERSLIQASSNEKG